MTDGGREEGRMGRRGKGRLGVGGGREAVRGFCAELGEIPAASAGMTEIFCAGWRGKASAGMTDLACAGRAEIFCAGRTGEGEREGGRVWGGAGWG